MDVARALAEAGAPEGVCAVADAQTAGRGRLGRSWYSPPGASLYVSALLFPDLAIARAGEIAMAAALTLYDTAAGALAGAGASSAGLSLKWPNDLLHRGAKLAGVLIESTLGPQGVERAIVGFGLNVNTDFVGAPSDVVARATSLRAIAGVEIDREATLEALADAINRRLLRFAERALSPRAEYLQRLGTLGQTVRLARGEGWVEGVAVDVAVDGALIIETLNGRMTVEVGELV